MSLTAILISKNELVNITECLESLQFCDEIIVLDSGSEDGTQDIAKKMGCLVFETSDWPGFGIQKQRALSYAKSDWILSIDADERVTPELALEILHAIKSDSFKGYLVSRRSWFLSRWMRFGGWSPDYVLRLARREHSRFDCSLVHEKMLVTGLIGRLKNPLLHYSYRTVKDALDKQKRYAVVGARVLTKKRKRNIGLMTALFHSLWTFVRLYILRLGLLDGREGFISATLKSQEVFWKYLAVMFDTDRLEP